MTEMLLYALIGVPVVTGIACYFVPSAKLRSALVMMLAVLVAAGGVLLVYRSCSPENQGNIWSLALPENSLWLGMALEFGIIAVILGVAIKIKNTWIIIFAVLQLLLAAGGHCLPEASHDETVTVFVIDNLTRIMLLVTTVVGALILVFSTGYMKEHAHHTTEGEKGLSRFFFFFCAFLGCMVGLVVSNQLTFFSAFWEATTLCSYALIGQDGGEARRVNAVRALLINSFGGTVLLLGIFILKYNKCDETISALINPANMMLFPAILLCIAAFTKSALFPFQSWLLGAMVAPTPVSAMLHSATMVKAGVYLIMRMTPVFYGKESVMLSLAICGAISFVAGALLAGTQSNGKKVLAYSTISNLGLVVACAGIDSPLAYAAGLAIIAFHAVSKGLLFLCMGRIEQFLGSRDIESMDGMFFKMPFTTCVALVGMMSMLLPPFGMLLSKWLAIEATMRSPLLLIFMVLGSALTVYFWAKWIGRVQNTGYHEHIPKERICRSMKFALGTLAMLVIVSGMFTIYIYSKVLVPMAQIVYNNLGHTDWTTFNEIGAFHAWIIFAFIAAGLAFYYFGYWVRFSKKSVRLPFLCGENISVEEFETNEELRSYDFHSVEGKIERSILSSYYFVGVIKEQATTRIINWAAFLAIIVLIGNTIVNK